MSAPLWQQSIEDLSPQIRDGALSPIALTETYLERIKAFDERLSSFVMIADDALEQAARAASEISDGRWIGPLHGIPIAVKDNYLTSDMPTRAGTGAPGFDFDRRDSNAVARLRDAGAVIIGKTRMHEFAWGNETPPTSNPWDVNRVPGGSSGGSGAAVAAGLCAAALGSDTGGSIRIPASICGTVGIKPTFGLVGRDGVVPHSWSLDHAGPLTATVADAATVLQVLAGPDAADPGCANVAAKDYSAAMGKPISGIRIGICRNHFFDALQTDIETAVENAVANLAAGAAEIKEFNVPNLAYGLGAIFAIELASSTAWHDRAIAEGRTKNYSDDVRTLVEIGRFVTAPDYLKAEQLRRLLMEDFVQVLSEVDVIVGPTLPLTAWRKDEKEVRIGVEDESVLAASWRLTYPWNLVGLPAISVPCGFDSNGLPIGLQFAGRPFDEAMLFHVADAYEKTQADRGLRTDPK